MRNEYRSRLPGELTLLYTSSRQLSLCGFEFLFSFLNLVPRKEWRGSGDMSKRTKTARRHYCGAVVLSVSKQRSWIKI